MSVEDPITYYVLQGLGSPTLQSLFGSRMFLNLKDAGQVEAMVSMLEIPMSAEIGTLSLRFAQKESETVGGISTPSNECV